ncbi:MAG: IMS domain-containing protein [Cyanobacteria bacterium P01_D01_bin.105]
MRIPLDYYRILGLPIQATAEQLKQSHRDRTLQIPRREYSELAIETRRELLDKAYEVLSDSFRRSEYDQAFLAASKGGSAEDVGLNDAGADVDANVPTIDIENHQLVGALLILLELGEYELVLRLGRPYLKRDVHTPEGQRLKAQPDLPDIILTLAVACLELGREEWQQNHYDHAAESLEIGRELLLKEDLFPVLRAEIQSDLYKLRPYRCLELIARPLEHKQARQEGIALLRGMLQDRGGIDGAEDDLSGLGVDDFLRFVQQLRGYLTAAEQQDVFEAEAQRPSAVGTYLAVYALLARGFAQHDPALIRRAKQMLLRLSGRQDVHLEQAVCAVLLGQTEEASRALELSQEFEPLGFIKQHSQGSPDLLPGLCLYAENWLQQEVFPFFRDLDQAPATLKDYFADSTVQSYLENLPLESSAYDAAPQRESRASIWSAQDLSQGNQGLQPLTAGGQSFNAPLPFGERSLSGQASGAEGLGLSSPANGQTGGAGGSILGKPNAANRPGAIALGFGAASAGAAGLAGKISQLSPSGKLGGRKPQGDNPSDSSVGGAVAGGAAAGGVYSRNGQTAISPRDRRRNRNSPKWGRLALVILAGLSCVILGLMLLRSVMSLVTGGGNGPALEGEPLDLTLNEPVIEIAEADVSGETAAPAPDDAEGIARATINQWLEAKKAAYASDYDTSGLNSILTGRPLNATQDDIDLVKSENVYLEFESELVEVLSVDPEDATDADTITVEAEVVESKDVFRNEQLEEVASYSNDVVSATYELVRQGDNWLIQDIR